MKNWRGMAIAVLIIAFLSLLLLFSKTYQYHDEMLRLNRDFGALEDKMQVKAGNWSYYLETRVNRLAQTQDEYQYSTSERIRLIEENLKRSGIPNQSQNKNVNINNINVGK